jgi:anti-sigma regulatory factor (Ser/Thr protein kinase)
MDVEMTLSGTPRGAGEARRQLQVLEPKVPQHVYTSLRLLVSELVSNWRTHVGRVAADESIQVLIRTSEDGVRVRLHDSQHGRAELDQSAEEQERSTWDLILLDELTDRWGILEDATGDVWFEILYDAPPG